MPKIVQVYDSVPPTLTPNHVNIMGETWRLMLLAAEGNAPSRSTRQP